MILDVSRVRNWRGSRLLWRYRTVIYASGAIAIAMIAINSMYRYALIPFPFSIALDIPLALLFALGFIAPAMKMGSPPGDG